MGSRFWASDLLADPVSKFAAGVMAHNCKTSESDFASDFLHMKTIHKNMGHGIGHEIGPVRGHVSVGLVDNVPRLAKSKYQLLE